jgi:hypothetical protein
MHRALFIAEILLEIFTHLTPLEKQDPCDEISTSSGLPELFSAKNPLSWDIRSRGYLAALARTCKTFHEPAMDLLWADTDDYGIEPLLGCVARLHPLIYRRDRMVSAVVSFHSFSLPKSGCRARAAGHKASNQGIEHGQKVSSHYLSTRPSNFCVMPPECATCL